MTVKTTIIGNLKEIMSKWFYTEDEMDEKLDEKADNTTVQSSFTEMRSKIDNKANSSHTHDDRYYTESEVNTKLNDKANSSHTHNITNIVDLQSTLDNKANSSHTHDDRYYTKIEVDNKEELLQSALDSLVGFTATIVDSLPSTGEEGIMYLTLSEGGVEQDIYNEYIWVNNKFEKIGNTSVEVDLSGYATVSFVNSALTDYVTQEDFIFQTGLFSVVGHTHDIEDIDNLQSTLDNKSNEGHTHTIGQISSLSQELASKAPTTVVTTSSDGLMSSTDKIKLDGIATGANKTTVDSELSTTSINPVQNKVINSALSGKAASSHTHSISNITNLQNTLNGKASTAVASTSANGLMTSAMVTKLNGIATGANKTTVDSSLSSTSTNPVQNKAVYSAIGDIKTAINSILGV
ncbi:MAG: hypothetical protein K8V75_04270 [Methanobrevibacter woesei]|nr:hypothetical protein [Methanobrevibacter woesei]